MEALPNMRLGFGSDYAELSQIYLNSAQKRNMVVQTLKHLQHFFKVLIILKS